MTLNRQFGRRDSAYNLESSLLRPHTFTFVSAKGNVGPFQLVCTRHVWPFLKCYWNSRQRRMADTTPFTVETFEFGEVFPMTNDDSALSSCVSKVDIIICCRYHSCCRVE